MSHDDSTDADPLIQPDDDFNRRLVANVHPPAWNNPRATDRYNLVVVGAGTAGLVTAAIGAGLGARVALVERHLMGGDCLNVGCVPSKSILRAARAWASLHGIEEFGLSIPAEVQGNFGTAMKRMRRLRARLSHIDSAQRFKDLGVDVFIGDGQFSSAHTIDVHGQTLRFRRAAVCTGARAAAPAVPGLQAAGYLTNETVFELMELPSRLAVIGAGPIGCEMAQAFARFGSRVTVFELADRILLREDADAAALVQAEMEHDGVSFALGTSVANVQCQDSERVIHFTMDGCQQTVIVDDILVGVGRTPNVEGLGLETAGIRYDKKGINVTATLQTSNSRIYAAGDICSAYKFTHTADAMAKILIQNALFPHPFGLGRASTDSLIVPWCTFTEPEIAHVGLNEAQARKRGIEVDTFTQTLDEVDRAVLDGEDRGFVRVHVKKGTDIILGATIVATHAGDMISELTLAMKAETGLGTIGATIHPYPTQADAIRKVANMMRRATFSESKKSILSRWFRWMR